MYYILFLDYPSTKLKCWGCLCSAWNCKH